LKIQQNYNNQPAFGMKVNINSLKAYCNGKPMITKEEKLLVQKFAEPIGLSTDVMDLHLGSILRLGTADKNNFIESYALRGKSVINEVESKVKLDQSWLHSEGNIDNHKPYDVIIEHLKSIIKKPRGQKK